MKIFVIFETINKYEKFFIQISEVTVDDNFKLASC